jgi:ACS family hexuronate transporter-like MFS transporter
VTDAKAAKRPSPIRHLRWRIGMLLFVSTVINYLDRQTLSNLAPFLKRDYGWTNTDYANLVIAFRIAYTFGQALTGRWLDRIGVRRGLTISVVWYSIVSICTALAGGWRSFAGFRFLLGAGESANWPGATKAVSEWFPKQERGLATALFDSGSSIGGAIAPFIIIPIYLHWGWRPAFIIPGLLGFVWLVFWRRLYHPPERHPRVSDEEREMILSDKLESETEKRSARARWGDLLKFPQTWGTIASKALTDPVWFFISDWFPIYLVAKGIKLETGFVGIWIPFIGSDLGNFFGGWMSGHLIKRGWSLGAARKALVIFGGLGFTILILTVFTTNLFALALLFGAAAFAYAAFSTIANVLPSDLYKSESVASVSGMSGTAAGIGTIIAFKSIGYFSDAHAAQAASAFDSIVIVASLVPLTAMILVLLLVRNTRATEAGLVRRI